VLRPSDFPTLHTDEYRNPTSGRVNLNDPNDFVELVITRFFSIDL
jgi:hypothetical protein